VSGGSRRTAASHLLAPQSQNLTHWSVLWALSHPHQLNAKSTLWAENRRGDVACRLVFGSISLIGFDSGSRGMLQSIQSVQQSADTGWVPFAAQCTWYL
jgi:hypothetical protein